MREEAMKRFGVLLFLSITLYIITVYDIFGIAPNVPLWPRVLYLILFIVYGLLEIVLNK